MGYANWIQLKIQNNTSKTLHTKNTYLHWGKFYRYEEKNDAVDINTVDNQDIKAGDIFSFASCGKENSWSGTEGEFDIFVGSERVCQVYWDCPFTGDNKLNVKYVKDKWFPMVPAVSTTGAIGSQTITLFTTA